MGALTPGLSQTPQEFANEIAAKLIGSVDSVGFQNGGIEPTSDVGPWLQNGRYWRFWNPATASYSLGIFNPGWQFATAEVAIDETTGLIYKCDGRTVTVAGDQLLFNAIGYQYNLPADMSGVNPINPLVFRIPDKRGRGSIGAGAGSGLTNRIQGTLYGAESLILTIAQMPAHQHSVQGCVTGTIPGQGFAVPGGQPASVLTSIVGGADPVPTLGPSQADNWIIFR